MKTETLATITETAKILEVPRGTIRGAIAGGWIETRQTAGGTTLVVLSSARKWLSTPRARGKRFGDA